MTIGKRLFVIIIIASIIIGGTLAFYLFYKELTSSSEGRMFAYKNDNADNKTNALTKRFEEFSSLDYESVLEDDDKFMFMGVDKDEWDGMHFIFDLSEYAIDNLVSINFTWIGGVTESDNIDVMEIWCYKDTGWVKLEEINEGDWVYNIQSYEWTSDLDDYVDADGKVHISMVVHCKNEIAALVTQFIKLEVG